MVLCIKCYTEGNYPNFLTDKDFEKMDLINKLTNADPTKTMARKPWASEETLKLLEKIEEHKDKWDEIIKAMPGRTREEIILHFLRLPLKNISQVRLFENEDTSNGGKTANGGGAEKLPYEHAANDEPTVFADSSNPLL